MNRLALVALLTAGLAGSAAARPSPAWIRQIQEEVERVRAVLSDFARQEDRAAQAERFYCEGLVPEARAKVFSMLQEHGTGAEALALHALTKDQDPRVRQAAATFLGVTGGEAARAALEDAGESDPDSTYNGGCYPITANARVAAKEALRELEARLGPGRPRSATTQAWSWLTSSGTGTPEFACGEAEGRP